VWDGLSSTVQQITPEDGQVQSVSWLGTSQLILGTGLYTLRAGASSQARLEVWQVDTDQHEFIRKVALPGVQVDAISVSYEDDEPQQIFAFSGLKSQDRGFVTVLDAESLVPVSVTEIPQAFSKRLECSERLIFVSTGGAVWALNRENGVIRWCHETSHERIDFAYDAESNQLLLSTGELLSAQQGRVLTTLTELVDCCCVRSLPEGGFVGISKSGAIGVWKNCN
jgi:hypothetical protein